MLVTTLQQLYTFSALQENALLVDTCVLMHIWQCNRKLERKKYCLLVENVSYNIKYFFKKIYAFIFLWDGLKMKESILLKDGRSNSTTKQRKFDSYEIHK